MKLFTHFRLVFNHGTIQAIKALIRVIFGSIRIFELISHRIHFRVNIYRLKSRFSTCRREDDYNFQFVS